MIFTIEYQGVSVNIEQLPNGKFKKPSVAEFCKQGRSVTWLDNCRIPFKSESDFKTADRPNDANNKAGTQFGSDKKLPKGLRRNNIEGRFPANLLCSDDILNDNVDKKSSGIYNHENSYSAHLGNQEKNPKRWKQENKPMYNDSGSFSRYFDLDAWYTKHIQELPESVQLTYPFLLVPKASKSEKNKGMLEQPELSKRLSGVAYNEHSGVHQDRKKGNFHPTVKPLKLMQYLIMLGSRENDIILDPFMGSGTTAIASKINNRQYIGFELEKEYHNIALHRLEAWQPEPQTRLEAK